MKSVGIFIAMAVAASIFVSCKDGQSPLVKRSTLEASQAEAQGLKDSLMTVQESYALQTQELSEILSELSSLNYQTVTLQINVENAAAEVSQADQIHNNIELVKNRIDKLEQEAKRARKLNKDLAISKETISKLRETVAVQEEKIAQLQKTISEKDVTISGQKETIESQLRTISNQKDEMARTLFHQTEMLFQAGLEFEELGDVSGTDLQVKGRKDKKKVVEFKKNIYNKALKFYQQAGEQNHREALERLDSVAVKIEQLESR